MSVPLAVCERSGQEPESELRQEEAKVKASLMLADHAQVVDGKFFICGGGWSVTGPDPIPFAIIADIKVPWHAIGTHKVRLELFDGDGQPVTLDTDEGEQPLFLEAEIPVAPLPGIKPGTTLGLPFAVNLAPQPCIVPGGLYEWRLSIDGKTHEDWNVVFSTRPALGEKAA